jgi:F-type H+-transporting ATPase subunit epsilon
VRNMSNKIHLEVVAPDRLVLKEDVDELTAPGLLGEFGILPGHTTFLAELGTGPLTYLKGGQSRSLQISGGFAEAREDKVTILADTVTE